MTDTEWEAFETEYLESLACMSDYKPTKAVPKKGYIKAIQITHYNREFIAEHLVHGSTYDDGHVQWVGEDDYVSAPLGSYVFHGKGTGWYYMPQDVFDHLFEIKQWGRR